jgi:hypothetical protein
MNFYTTHGNLTSKTDASKPIADLHTDQFYNNTQLTAPLPRQTALNFLGKKFIPYREMIDASTQNTDGFEHLNNSSDKLSEKEKLHTTPIKKNYLP